MTRRRPNWPRNAPNVPAIGVAQCGHLPWAVTSQASIRYQSRSISAARRSPGSTSLPPSRVVDVAGVDVVQTLRERDLRGRGAASPAAWAARRVILKSGWNAVKCSGTSGPSFAA